MFLDAEFGFDAFFMSRYRCWAFKSRHDSATTAPEIERLLRENSVPVDEFGRSKTLAEPCACVEIGCESELEGMDESGEAMKVKFEASGSEG